VLKLYGQLFRLYGILPSVLDAQDAEEFAQVLAFAFAAEDEDETDEVTVLADGFVVDGKRFYEIKEE
jgi:hypothetical protein